MDSKSYLRDCYDLCYSRALIQKRFDVEESEDTRQARVKHNKRTSKLSEISKTLCQALEKNDALISGINVGTHHLLRDTNDTALSAPRKRDIEFGPSRPDTDAEEAIIRARLVSASHLAGVLVDSLKQINQVILQTNINSARPPQEPTPEEPTVFYRLCHKKTHTSHDADLGFWSPRGLPNYDFCEPLESEFRAHIAYRAVYNGANPKKWSSTFESPYISLSTDPGKIFNIGQDIEKRGIGGLQHVVYQIEATKLREMKVGIESTLDAARRWDIKEREKNNTQFISDDNWLAKFWVPAECITGKLPFSEFEELCKEHGVVKGGKSWTAGGVALPVDAFKRRCESPLQHPSLPIQEVKTVHDSDSEPTTSASLLGVVAPKKAFTDDDSGNEPTASVNFQSVVAPNKVVVDDSSGG